jgi:kinesin family protein 1
MDRAPTAEIGKQSECIIQMDGDMTTIRKPDDGSVKSFSFDHSYWSYDKNDPNYAGQQRIYDDLGVELLNHAFSGYNTCIVACKYPFCDSIVLRRGRATQLAACG